MKEKEKLKIQWNNVYSNYDKKRFSIWREEPTSFFVDKIDYLKHKNLKNVLDAGCGDGRNLSAFARTGFKTTGVDISESALKICKEKYSKLKNISLKQASIKELDLIFKKETFDVILCDFVLAHIKNVKKVLDIFYKLLKKDGYALLEFSSPKTSFFGQGKKIGKNQFIQKNIFIRFFTIKEIEDLLKKYKIFFIDAQYYTDPDHGKGYHRKKRHMHHSYFVLAQK